MYSASFMLVVFVFFFFSSRRRHTRFKCDWSSDVCSSDLLVGRVEHIAQMGTLVTDFSLIKAGALHRANGGYLVLDAMKLLTQPFAWEALKRNLRSREIRTEPLGQALSLISTVSLTPQPIPLEVKGGLGG